MSRFVTVEVIDHEPDDAEAEALARRVAIILSCPADFEHRLRLNRAAHRAGIRGICRLEPNCGSCV